MPTVARATPARTESAMGLTIRALVVLRGAAVRDLAAYLNLTPQKVSDRLSGATRWQIQELRQVAKFLDVPVGLLFADPADLISRLGQESVKFAEGLELDEQLRGMMYGYASAS